MHNHGKVQAGDLSRLERAVRSATRAGGVRHHRQQAQTSRSAATPRPATARSTGAYTHRSATSSRDGENLPTRRTTAAATARSNRGQGTARSGQRPSTAGSATSRSRHQQHDKQRQQQGVRRRLQSSRGSSGSGSHDDGRMFIPINIKNEWLILDTYQQILADEKQAEEDRQAQAGACCTPCTNSVRMCRKS